jgi:hypothetical protein
MKHITSILFVILILLAIIFLIACQNNELSKINPEIGLNGSFETVEGGYPVNWTFFPNPETNASIRVILDSEDVLEGKYSLKLVVQQQDKIPGFRSRRVAVEAGKRYKLTMSIKAVGCTFRVNRIIQDRMGKKNLRTKIIANTSTSSGDWQDYDETLDIIKGESYVLLIFLVEGTGEFWSDNIQLRELANNQR